MDFARKCCIFVLQKGRTARFSPFFGQKMAKTTFDVVKTSFDVVKISSDVVFTRYDVVNFSADSGHVSADFAALK